MNFWVNPISIGHYIQEKESPLGFPGGSVVKNFPANVGDAGEAGSVSRIRKILWRRKWQPTLVFLPGKSHGQRSPSGYSPQGCKELYMTQQLSLQSKSLTYKPSNCELSKEVTMHLHVESCQSTCLVYVVTCVHPLQVAVLLCTLLQYFSIQYEELTHENLMGLEAQRKDEERQKEEEETEELRDS